MQARENKKEIEPKNINTFFIPEWTDKKEEIILNNNGRILCHDEQYVIVQIDSGVLRNDIRIALGIDRRLLSFNNYINERYLYLKSDPAITIELKHDEEKFLVTFPLAKLETVTAVATKWMSVAKSGQQFPKEKRLWWKNIKRRTACFENEYHDDITLTLHLDDIKDLIEYVKKTDAVYLSLSIKSKANEVDHAFFKKMDLHSLFKEIENNNQIKSFYASFLLACQDLDQIKLLLTPGILKKIVYDLSRFRYSKDNYFLHYNIDYLVNKNIVDYMLAESSPLAIVLDQCQPYKQIYLKSCAAHVIMKFLYAKQNSEKFSMLTEIKIYNEICTELGELADPRKIKEYLQLFDVDVCLIEDEELVKEVISTSPELGIKYEYTKSIFDHDHHKKSGINEKTFPHNTAMLIVVDKGTHMMIAERLSNGDIVLQDPVSPDEVIFHGIDSLNKSRLEENIQPSMKTYSGLAFNLFYKNKHQNNFEEKKTILSCSI